MNKLIEKLVLVQVAPGEFRTGFPNITVETSIISISALREGRARKPILLGAIGFFFFSSYIRMLIIGWSCMLVAWVGTRWGLILIKLLVGLVHHCLFAKPEPRAQWWTSPTIKGHTNMTCILLFFLMHFSLRLDWSTVELIYLIRLIIYHVGRIRLSRKKKKNYRLSHTDTHINDHRFQKKKFNLIKSSTRWYLESITGW